MKSAVKSNKYEDETDFLHVLDLVKTGNNIFVTGGAGVGKSYILSRLKDIYGNKLHVTSTTGISALNVNGQTLHSWAGIGIANKPINDVIKRINKRKVLLKNLKRCQMLAIDEISMLDNRTFDYVNEVLKLVRQNDDPFGGIQVLIFGDFFQLPPVRMEEDERDFCFNSFAWQELDLKYVLLKKVWRQSDDKLVKSLNNVRLDKISEADLKMFYDRNFNSSSDMPEDVLQIFGSNAEADGHNAKCFAKLDGKQYVFTAKDKLYNYDVAGKCVDIITDENIRPESLNVYDLNDFKKFNEYCKAPKQLVLKEGCRVMLLRNLNLSKGLANGSCGVVSELSEDSVCVKFDNGEEYYVGSCDFEYIKEGQVKISRTQIPLRLAYGITIHKSQGMTFDKLIVNFNRVFDYGQAYVALSRTRSLEGLTIIGFNHNKIIVNSEVVNFYKKIEKKAESFLNY